MGIAEVAPLFFPVPPLKYGGVARLVSYLTEELVTRGHDVTLFASGDSRTSARLISPCAAATGFGRDPGWHHVILQAMIARRAWDFDIIHIHEVGAGLHQFPLLRLLGAPCVVTYHLALPVTAANEPFFREFSDIPSVSLSHAQRRPAPWMNWQATIYHGLPVDLYRFEPDAASYLAFIGRISRHKGLDDAIQIALAAGRPLKVAGAASTADDRAYLESRCGTAGAVDYVGEIGDEEKQTFLGKAAALLLPLATDEPGPVTAVESLACGTPVIGYRRSFLPEVIENGLNGFVVDDVAAAIAAVSSLDRVSRARCRAEFERRFSLGDKCEEYLRVFQRVAVTDGRCRDKGSAQGHHKQTQQNVIQDGRR